MTHPSHPDFDGFESNPYLASPKADTDAWYDSFAKGGRVVWLVFDGPRLLAQVQNAAQASNVVHAIRGARQKARQEAQS